MRGKHIFIITALISILMLSACGQKNGSATVATATDSTITKDNFEKQLKDRYGKRHAIRNDGTRRHHKKI